MLDVFGNARYQQKPYLKTNAPNFIQFQTQLNFDTN